MIDPAKFKEITHHTLTVWETAELLGLRQSQVMHLCKIGWLDHVEIAGVTLIEVTMCSGALAVIGGDRGIEVTTAPRRYRPFQSRRRSLASRLKPRLVQ